MTTEAAVNSRDSERHPAATPAMVSCVQPAEHVAVPVEGSNHLNAYMIIKYILPNNICSQVH